MIMYLTPQKTATLLKTPGRTSSRTVGRFLRLSHEAQHHQFLGQLPKVPTLGGAELYRKPLSVNQFPIFQNSKSTTQNNHRSYAKKQPASNFPTFHAVRAPMGIHLPLRKTMYFGLSL